MKRSTSRKESSMKPGDGTQQKISSFFQPGPAQAQSKLFSSVAAKSKPPHSLKRQIISSQSSTATNSTKIVTITTQPADVSKSSMTLLKDFNRTSVPHDETPHKSAPEDLSLEESPEVIAIPDTPDAKLPKSWPKPASRSFLCPVTKLATMPGKRQSPPKLKQRKTVKKSLGVVSIELGKKPLSDSDRKESERRETSMIMAERTTCSSADTVVISDFDLDNLSSLSAKPHDCKLEMPTTNQLSVQSVTPTKKSGDRHTVKRMAVQGLSPQPKRIFEGEAGVMNDGQTLKNRTSQNKVQRQIASMAGFKDVKEMNQSLNNYQLGGSTKSLSKTESSCMKDDVLADILGEMMDKTPQRKLSEKKTPSPHTMKQTNPVVCNPVEDMETETLCDVAEDNVLKDILGELDSKLCHNQSSTSQHKPKLCSRNRSFLRNKTRIKAEDIKLSIAQSMDQDSSSNLIESCESFQDKGAMTCELSAGIQGSGNLRPSADDAQQTRCTPTKISEPVNVGVKDPVNSELVCSFQQMSPFKKRAPQRNSKSQTAGPPESNMKFTDRWNRYVVHNVSIDRHSHEKLLQLSKEGVTEITQTAKLQGFWSDTHVESGDIVHLLLEDQEETCIKNGHNGKDSDPIIIDDNRGQIVVNPDLLLSGTTVVSGVFCLRKSVLNEKFKGVDSKNVHMLYGSIIHSLFQEVLKERLTTTEEIMAVARSIVKSSKFLHEMYGQGVTAVKVLEEINAYVSPLQAWVNKHVPSISQKAGIRGSSGREDVRVVQIHDIEETIWSPRIGVKGKIDMTVEVEVQREGVGRRTILPLELKTGKASYSAEHKGQVTLYSMMMSDRRQSPEEGLLLYLKHNDMSAIPVKPHNTRGLLQLRNEMAYYLSRQAKAAREDGEDGCGVSHSLGPLPAPINNRRSCAKCPQLLNCAAYQRTVEKLQHAPDHAMSTLVPETLSHLSDSHLSYFWHWVFCMDLETATQNAESLRNIWCMSSSERERQGDCLQQMVMTSSVLGVPETQAFTEGRGCCVALQRRPGFPGGALNTSGLVKNDAVVISSEDGRFIALSTGFIKNITETIVDVVVDRDSVHENEAFGSLVLRIDRCEAFNTASYLLTNLSRLLTSDPHCQKLRSLIIDGRKPEFQLTMSKSAVEKVKKIFRPLNKPQKTAILKVLMSKDYVLIKGYPGTGKTSTIVALVKILRELGQSVLLTSYTHSAVDNILLKLKKDGVPFLRLGRSSRIHPHLLDHAAETLTLDITSVDQLRDFYSSYGIVATSCLGVTHAMFSQRRFDVCIVDEASQVLQPACLGPLFYANRFVLVGDPLQLPPVVQSKEASSLGMGESLFAGLDGAGATYDLHLQYRMNSTVMQLSNELVYKGALCCGSDAVSTACIQPHHLPLGGETEWLRRALDSDLSNAVIFLDTCQIAALESSSSKGLTNRTEAVLILRLCTTFVQAGVSASDIGVIAPYRAQVRALQECLSEFCPLKEVEVNTVDQYQGRDKSVICISFVRSSGNIEADLRGGLLQDVRRLNVAVTRAKHKLVLVGDSRTLTGYQPLATLISNLKARNQILPLPADLQLDLEEAADL